MDVHGARARVEKDQVLLDLADAADGGFEDALDIDTLLRVDHLIVAFFKVAIDVDILDVELGQMLEDFLIHPSLD